MTRSYDAETVDGFGFEWSVYDQSERDPESTRRSFERYFTIFPWDELPADAVGIDVGCGSGRWMALVAERGYRMVGLDPAYPALKVAHRNAPTAALVQGSAVDVPLRPGSLDFGFSLGVLHHIPDTEGALRGAVATLKPGAPFLVYLYYAFDNRPAWFRALWKVSDTLRRAVSHSPHAIRLAITRAIAAVVYFPLARAAKVLERTGRSVESFPLSGYRDQPFYVMQTDALDRFGTQLEKRYTRAEIVDMLAAAGLERIEVHDGFPYWCAMGRVPA